MNWYDRLLRRKPKDVIPNRRERFENIERSVLETLQFFVITLAVLILLQVAQ